MNDELAPLARGQCPDCGGIWFHLGPRGGASRNVECAGCASRFNVTPWYGRVIFPQRIPRFGEREGPHWEEGPAKLTDRRAMP